LTYRLTVRQGPRVERAKYDSLDEAVAALEERVRAIRASGPLRPRRMLRTFEPAAQVAGRVELAAGGGLLRRGREAGVDVMGDGRLVAYAGGMKRAELDPGDAGPFAAVRRALEGS
jgi:hypothetical protein